MDGGRRAALIRSCRLLEVRFAITSGQYSEVQKVRVLSLSFFRQDLLAWSARREVLIRGMGSSLHRGSCSNRITTSHTSQRQAEEDALAVEVKTGIDGAVGPRCQQDSRARTLEAGLGPEQKVQQNSEKGETRE